MSIPSDSIAGISRGAYTIFPHQQHLERKKRTADETTSKANPEKNKILELLLQGRHDEAMLLLSKRLTKATPGNPA
jgi:hypothetical protein